MLKVKKETCHGKKIKRQPKIEKIDFGNLQDSGKRKIFSTGAMRDRPGNKGAFSLISPLALKRLAIIYEKGGSGKYTPRNWEKGMPFSDVLESAIRHINQALEKEPSEDHLAQAAWNLFAVMHYQVAIERGLLPEELDDIPGYQPISKDKK